MRNSVSAASEFVVTLSFVLIVAWAYWGFGKGTAGKPLSEKPMHSLTEQSVSPTLPTTRNTASMPGTIPAPDIDANLKTDENGNLIADIAIKDLFEYFWAN